MSNKILTIIALIIKGIILYFLIKFALTLNSQDYKNIFVWILLYLPMAIGYEYLIKTMVIFITKFFTKKD